MLTGREFEFADLERSIAEPISMVVGRWLSNEGLADAGDLGMLSWDLDLDSNEGRAGKAYSGFSAGLDRGLPGGFSNERDWLEVRP